MLGPHIFGSARVACFMSFTSARLSARFWSSSTVFRNASTLAPVGLVFGSAMGVLLATWVFVRAEHIRPAAEPDRESDGGSGTGTLC